MKQNKVLMELGRMFFTPPRVTTAAGFGPNPSLFSQGRTIPRMYLLHLALSSAAS